MERIKIIKSIIKIKIDNNLKILLLEKADFIEFIKETIKIIARNKNKINNTGTVIMLLKAPIPVSGIVLTKSLT